MQLIGEPKAYIRSEAQDFIDLYSSLGEHSENFLPKHIFDNLTNFVKLCYEEPDDPAKQQAEIDKYVLELRETIPSYIDVSLMLYPTEDSKAFFYKSKKQKFTNRITNLTHIEAIDENTKEYIYNILNSQDYSIGTPPVIQDNIKTMSKLLLGDTVEEIRKFRDVIGVNGQIEQTHWEYFMFVIEQMVNQISHYTTEAEKTDFIYRVESAANFRGLDGFIRTVVSGSTQTAINLIKGDVFNSKSVVVIDNFDTEKLYQEMILDTTSIFVIKVNFVRRNIFIEDKWFPLLSRIIILDNSIEGQSSNTTLVFAFHNKVIKTLDKIHTKKIGALANSQLNIRLILEKVNSQYLYGIRIGIENKIKDYEKELTEFKKEQLNETNSFEKNLALYRFNEFAKQILKDKYTLQKLHDFIYFIELNYDTNQRRKQNQELKDEFEARVGSYFYSKNSKLKIATILEGGGRNQIRTYGEYLIQRNLKDIDSIIIDKCKTIIDIIPDNYNRTLKNHFHKNFGINLFLEKYKIYLSKIDNEADNKGRFKNILIDLDILEDYESKNADQQQIIKEFISSLANLDKTSISDEVQMIIRDLLFYENGKPKPYILYNKNYSWEYTDLFHFEDFDINPFDIEIDNTSDGHIDYEILITRLERIKASLQLFDETGNLWDRFCENTTIIINDPSNPSGYTDFNKEELKQFLRFVSNTKITLLLDEAYTDSVKIWDLNEPKWRSISRYVMNNISTYSKISVVASVSTTKSLQATGARLGALIATPAKEELISFAKEKYDGTFGNSNSLYILNCTLETAQLAKIVKDQLEASLPKNASINRIRKRIKELIKLAEKTQASVKTNRLSSFEGSPLYIYLLEELVSLDKFEVLGVPDDFKYNGEAFFSYYNKHITKELNKFRVNKNFRTESNIRLKYAKDIANRVLNKDTHKGIDILESNGSYLFNLMIKDYFSYQDLEKFTAKLAEERGLAILPYKIGGVRFSLGGYIEGSEQAYKIFKADFENALTIFLHYWQVFSKLKSDIKNKNKRSEDILDEIFKTNSDKEFINNVLKDFDIVKNLKRKINISLKIKYSKSIYQIIPETSGVTISTIFGSENSVFEFSENIGKCPNLYEFILSSAFTSIYENLLPYVYKKIPLLNKFPYKRVLGRYGKHTIQKYVKNKISYQPNHHVIDNPDEENIMKEILIELEKILFSDSKMKILTLNASEHETDDLLRLEGINMILKKNIHELLLYFNLPFENQSAEPTIEEIVIKGVEKFEDIVGKKMEELNLKVYADEFITNFRNNEYFRKIPISERSLGYIIDTINRKLISADISFTKKLVYMYLLKKEDSFKNLLIKKLQNYYDKLNSIDDEEVKLISENLIFQIAPKEFDELADEIFAQKDIKIKADDLAQATRKIVLFFKDIINMTKGTDYYNKYTHSLIKMIETEFAKQNSSVNEMIQHGITIHKDFEIKNKTLKTYKNGELNWINDIMSKCGVIASERAIQMHTRIATDAKKREFPFHKIDRVKKNKSKETTIAKNRHIYESLKDLDTKPDSSFFSKRLADFSKKLESNDYRCKIVNTGLVRELYIFHKTYIKYLTDNFRLNQYDYVSLNDAQNFIPEVIEFYGVPEKVISYPEIGYFDIEGPEGNIKTIVTPLNPKVDYFGNIKKPHLLVINEKVKEKGGVPIHGSMFAVELDDGSIFVIAIVGDSGVGKSEMIAALILKWLKKVLQGIRSIKLIAGDMFHKFPDKHGNLYGIGTEVGDFSRVTDFDPDYIKYYKFLFETSADSNVEDLNSRSTISGLCDITMPYKIDILLSASNYAKEEAGIIRYDNPENFILYRDSHGERKEKATSQDGPHFQRTLLRYGADKNISDILEKHGNYIDHVLDWVKDEKNGKYYLSSSYKMMDKIDINELVGQIFIGKEFTNNKLKYTIQKITFDVIKNRFNVMSVGEQNNNYKCYLDRVLFSSIFDSLASTPAGQPFLSEDGQIDSRKHLINVLKGGEDRKGEGRKIKLGILSTDLGKKGKEISGPQKAAIELRNMIQEVRTDNHSININKNYVRKLLKEKYPTIINNFESSMEVWRYNFYLYQLEQMNKAKFVRIDDMKTEVDISYIKSYNPVNKTKKFSPLLVTPNINIELSSFSESYEQLMSLPNNAEYANEFQKNVLNLYIADGYSNETIVNNMIIQLLLMNGYILLTDLAKGRITEKVSKETLASAKFTAINKIKSLKDKGKAQKNKKA